MMLGAPRVHACGVLHTHMQHVLCVWYCAVSYYDSYSQLLARYVWVWVVAGGVRTLSYLPAMCGFGWSRAGLGVVPCGQDLRRTPTLSYGWTPLSDELGLLSDDELGLVSDRSTSMTPTGSSELPGCLS